MSSPRGVAMTDRQPHTLGTRPADCGGRDDSKGCGLAIDLDNGLFPSCALIMGVEKVDAAATTRCSSARSTRRVRPVVATAGLRGPPPAPVVRKRTRPLPCACPLAGVFHKQYYRRSLALQPTATVSTFHSRCRCRLHATAVRPWRLAHVLWPRVALDHTKL